MIKRIVMWRLRESAQGASGGEDVRRMRELLEGFHGMAPGAGFIEVGINAIPSEGAADGALCERFADKTALDAYTKHPWHAKVGGFVKEVVSGRQGVDYEA